MGLSTPAAGGSTTHLQTQFVCGVTAKGKTVRCTKAQLARIEALIERYNRAVRPTQGQSPRVAAVLRLPYGYRELLLAWRGHSGRVCMSAAEAPGGSTTEPFGPCVAAARLPAKFTADPLEPCGAICLADSSTETAGTNAYLLAGTVAPVATSLRVTVGGGAVTTCPLLGPLLRGTRSRVFMTVLGSRNWRRIELLRDSTVVATKTMAARMAAYSDCAEEYADSNRSRYDACVRKVKESAKP